MVPAVSIWRSMLTARPATDYVRCGPAIRARRARGTASRVRLRSWAYHRQRRRQSRILAIHSLQSLTPPGPTARDTATSAASRRPRSRGPVRSSRSRPRVGLSASQPVQHRNHGVFVTNEGGTPFPASHHVSREVCRLDQVAAAATHGPRANLHSGSSRIACTQTLSRQPMRSAQRRRCR